MTALRKNKTKILLKFWNCTLKMFFYRSKEITIEIFGECDDGNIIRVTLFTSVDYPVRNLSWKTLSMWSLGTDSFDPSFPCTRSDYIVWEVATSSLICKNPDGTAPWSDQFRVKAAPTIWSIWITICQQGLDVFAGIIDFLNQRRWDVFSAWTWSFFMTLLALVKLFSFVQRRWDVSKIDLVFEVFRVVLLGEDAFIGWRSWDSFLVRLRFFVWRDRTDLYLYQLSMLMCL